MKTLNEQISRIKQIMNIHEDEGDTMALLQQDTEAFNQELEEDLTVEEYKEISCQVQAAPDDVPVMEPEVSSKLDQDGKGKLAQITEKIKRASIQELKAEKRKIKEAMASKNKGEMSEQEFLVATTVFGVPLGWALFIAISAWILGYILYRLIKTWLDGNPMRRGRCTDPIL